MQITLYRSILCPRCFMAKKYLEEIAQQKSNITIEEIDIMNQPLKSWQNGIRLIPAIKIEDKILSGIFLNKTQISNFINDYESDPY